MFSTAAAESADFHVVVVAGNDDSEAGGNDDDLSRDCQEFFSSSEDRQTVVHRFDSLHTEPSCESEHQPRSWVSLIDEEEEAAEQDAVAEAQDKGVVEQQQADQVEIEKVEEVTFAYQVLPLNIPRLG